MPDPSPPGIVQFSVFEVDLRSGELRKRGVRVPLQQQPFRMLVALLKRPGEVVTRDEVQHELWPADTFVDFDQGLNTAVRRLRDALGDSAETPRFIETLPRHGYRFIAPIQFVGVAAVCDPASTRVQPQATLKRWLIAVAGLLAIAAAMAAWRADRQSPLTEADVIVLGDLDNQTAEPVLTGTLKEALAVKLSESHFVNLLSEQQVQETLAMMRRKPDEPLTPALARDVCERAGAKATLSGAVASLGSSYAISLNATACSTGKVLAREQARASRKEEILPTLDGLTVRLRRRLGESLRAVNAANTSLERATTSSLEALKAFTEGERRFSAGSQLDAIAFYKRAIELDPDFAMAHAKLAAVYFNGGMPDAVPELTKAFELRERLTEREQFYVTGHYHRLARGDLESSRPVYEVWKASYPRDQVPYTSLGLLYTRQGQLDRALAEFEGAVRAAPVGATYSNLFDICLQMARVDDAARVLERWERARGAPIHYGRFLLAFQQRNLPAVEAHGAMVRSNREGVFNVDAERARAAAFFGRIRRARELFAAAEAAYEGAGSLEDSAILTLEEALWEAEIGNCQESRKRVAEAWLHRADVRPHLVQGLAASALAACGDAAKAAKAVAELHTPELFDRPTPTLQIFIPAAHARIDLAQRRFVPALESLRRFERGDLAGPLGYSLAGQGHALVAAHLRGLAHLGLHQGAEAAAEFRKIADHPGVARFASYQALAPLNLARAYAVAGDTERSRSAYRQFLFLWRDADPDIPVLRAAQWEYARLPRP